MTSVFSSIYASQYDTLYGQKAYVAECDLIEEAFGTVDAKPRRILDVGCGTGSHMLEMARRGYLGVGVDLSSAMLDEAKRKAAASDTPEMVRWIQGDARTFDAGEAFDAAIMMFAVIGYMTSNEDVLEALRNVRRHLQPGAPFVCDFWYGPAVLSVRPTDRVRILHNDDEQTIRAASTVVDSFTQTADVTFQMWNLNGEKLASQTNETHRMRYFFPQEFRLMLNDAGFESLRLSAFPSLDQPLLDDSWNALSIARAR